MAIWNHLRVWKQLRVWRHLRGKTAKTALLATAVLASVTVLRAWDPPPVAQLRDRSFDIYQHLQPRPYTEAPVRVVDIDEASLAQYGQWPWPRTLLAQFINRLNDLGAAVIALDMIFPEPDRTSPGRIAGQLNIADPDEARRVKTLMSQLPDHDEVFAKAIEQAPVVLGFAAVQIDTGLRPPVKVGLAVTGADTTKVVQPPFIGAAVNLEQLDRAASGVGALSISARDKSGIVRRVPLLFTDGAKTYPNLSAEALRVAQQQQSIVVKGTGASGEFDIGLPALKDLRIGQFVVPTTQTGELWVWFDHDRRDRYVSFKDVLDPAKEAEIKPKIEGQIVFVGTSAAGLLDNWPTPLGELVPGVSIHAQAVEQIISQQFLSRPDWADGLEIVATVVFGALLTWLLIALGAQYAALAGGLIIAASLALSWFAFSQQGVLLDPIYPSIGAAATYLAVVGLLYVTTDREKKFVRRAFGQYVAPELLHKLEQAPQSMQLGGETKQITIMFMDVRDFTPISEGLTAVELVEFMNALLSALTDAIQSELGTIDKYIGDSIMAFWNAPLDIADHPRRACLAALKMREVLANLNSNDAFGFRDRDLSAVKIGIGLHTGEACVGNMGSLRRFNYTAMGDVVNTSARIESSCKAVGMDIVVSEEIVRAVPGLAFLEAGAMPLKGKARPLKLFGLLGDEARAASPEFVELSQRHAALLAAIVEGRTGDASKILAHCRALGGTLMTNFYNRFDEKITEIASGEHLAQVI